MNTKNSIQISNLLVETVKKDIKNIHLAVYPPNGRIRVASPLNTSEESIRLLVISKIPWIKKQQAKILNQERQAKREYVSGESHYFLGKRYRLNVQETNLKPSIGIKQNTHIHMYIKPNNTFKHRGKLLENWYKSEMKKEIIPLLDKWSKLIDVQIPELVIRKMRTRWGTCDHKSRKINLNTELIKKPAHCMEYVLVHELIHLIEPNHSDIFKARMDQFMPNWQQYKKELNNAPLSYTTWSY